MLRIINIVIAVLVFVTAGFSFQQKYDAYFARERIRDLQYQLVELQRKEAILHAEWFRLNNPKRLETLANRHLDIQITRSKQFHNLNNLPERINRKEQDMIANLLGNFGSTIADIIRAQ